MKGYLHMASWFAVHLECKTKKKWRQIFQTNKNIRLMSLMWFLVIVRAPGRGGWWGAVRNSSNHSHREIKRLRVVKLSFFYLPVQNENNVGRIRIITLTSMTSYPRDPAQTHFHNNFKFHGQFLTFNLEVLINFVRTLELRQLTLTRSLRRKLRMR